MKTFPCITRMLFVMLFCAAAVFSQDDAVAADPAAAVPADPAAAVDPAVAADPADDVETFVVDVNVPDAEEPVSAVLAEELPVDLPIEQEKVPGAKPKIAVYVTGGANEADNRALTTYILSALIRVKSNQYEAIERSEAFLTQIDTEHIKQRSGAVDDAQISQLGKQSGVQFVCVADITPVRGSYQVSARILDVETAKVVTVGVANSPLRHADDLRKVATAVVEAMFNLISPDTTKRKLKVKVGGQMFYNNSYLRGVAASETYPDDEIGIVVNTYENRLGYGSGFEIGGVVTVSLPVDFLSVAVGFSFIYRNPANLEILKIHETALVTPVSVQWRVLKDQPLYVEAGVQPDFSLASTISFEGADSEKFDDRKSFDMGLMAGVGYFIDKNFYISMKAVMGLMQFDSYENHKMGQVSLGVGYMF